MVPSVRSAADAHRHLQSLAAWRWGAIAAGLAALAMTADGVIVPAAAAVGLVAAVLLACGAEVTRQVVVDEWTLREDLAGVPELARARRRMTTDAHRRALARSLREIALQRSVPRHAIAPMLLSRVEPVRGELLAMAEEVERSPRLDPRTIAEINGLVTDGARSPLLNEAVPEPELAILLRRIRFRLAAGAAGDELRRAA
jgi:hypothetical protein